jgi:hypothetical protein
MRGPSPFRLAILWIALALAPSLGRAVNVSSDLPTATTLPTVQVEASSGGILPGSCSSAYAIPMDVIDTPRAVTPVSKTLMEAAGIGQWGKWDPLSITYLNPAAMVDPSQTSCASAPDIRGRQGLTFLNGIEENVNFGMQDVPWNFNMVESMDLVEGPPGAVYGATQPSNGYVNYITKQPYFDRFRGDAWATMGMYDQYMWGADIGGPIDHPAEGQSSKLGYRFSYLGMENSSYYDSIFDQQENFYGAIGWHPNDRYHADLYADFGTYSYMLEDVLMNRPTESLIQDGLYYPGYPSLSQVSSPGTVPANHFLGTPVPVSRRQTVKYPGDLGRAITGMAQLIQSVVVSDDLQVVNNTLFWYQDHIASEDEIFFQEAWNAYEIDNRTEVRGKFTTPGPLGRMEHFLDTGIEWRYQQALAYDSLEFTVPNQWSVFENPYLRNGAFTPAFQAWVGNPSAPGGGEWLVPGGPYPFYFEPLNGATGSNLTRYWKVSPFWQQTIQITDALSVILGARLDLYMISAQTPPGTPAILFEQLDTTQALPLFNVSPTWKPYPWMTTYFNFNWAQASDVGGGGGYSPTFTNQSFHLVNELEELGVKFSLARNRLFLSADVFHENTYLFNYLGPANSAQINGLETTATFQPNRSFWIRANYLFMTGVENWSSSPYGPPLTQTYSTAQADRLGLPLDNSGSFPPGSYALIGWPEQTVSGMVTYQDDSGVGVTLGGLLFSDMYLGYEHQVRIPPEFVLNAQVFYAQRHWEARLYLFNFTDERYWLPNGFAFSRVRTLNLDTIYAGWPFWIEGTVTWKF